MSDLIERLRGPLLSITYNDVLEAADELSRLRLQPTSEEVARCIDWCRNGFPSDLDGPMTADLIRRLELERNAAVTQMEIDTEYNETLEKQITHLRSMPTSAEVQTILCSMPLEFAGHPWSRRACDLIESLARSEAEARAENAALAAAMPSEGADACMALAVCQSELAAHKADAERYRWLQQNHGPNSIFRVAQWNMFHGTHFFIESDGLDAAIDAARGK